MYEWRGNLDLYVNRTRRSHATYEHKKSCEKAQEKDIRFWDSVVCSRKDIY